MHSVAGCQILAEVPAGLIWSSEQVDVSKLFDSEGLVQFLDFVPVIVNGAISAPVLRINGSWGAVGIRADHEIAHFIGIGGQWLDCQTSVLKNGGDALLTKCTFIQVEEGCRIHLIRLCLPLGCVAIPLEIAANNRAVHELWEPTVVFVDPPVTDRLLKEAQVFIRLQLAVYFQASGETVTVSTWCLKV